MRTTMSLDDDALKLARAHARERNVSLGHAVSELVRRGAQQRLVTQPESGLSVADLPANAPVVTAEHVRRLAEGP